MIESIEPKNNATNNKELDSSKFDVVVSRKSLLKSLSHIQNIVERRNIIPILSNVKLTAHNNKLELKSTDMDIAASEKVSAKINQEGAITLPAHTLYDIIRKIPDGSDIFISLNKNAPGKININAQDSVFSLPFLSASEYPSIELGIMPFKFKIHSNDLKAIVDKNKSAISTEETRYNLNGIYIHIVSNKDKINLNSVATDGHRLSKFEIPAPIGAEKIPGIIIPKKAVQELRKTIDNYEGDILVNLSETKIKFSFADIEFITKLIDGNFPEYETLIPEKSTLSMTIKKQMLIESVDRVSTITFDKTRSVKMLLNDNTLELIVQNDDTGIAKEKLTCKSNAQSFEIGFNARYLIDALNTIESEEAEFRFNDSFSPALILDANNSSTKYVIMPMRI